MVKYDVRTRAATRTDHLRADVRAHLAIGERALPECAHKKRLLAHAVSLRFAAERRAVLCVFDRRRRGAARRKQSPNDGKADASVEGHDSLTNVRECFGEADRVEWRSAGTARDDDGYAPRDDPWWFADGVVVLVTAADADELAKEKEKKAREDVSEAPRDDDDDDDDDDAHDDDDDAHANVKPRVVNVSTQFPDERFFDRFSETTEPRGTTSASETTSARDPPTTSAGAWSFPSLGDWSDWAPTSKTNADTCLISRSDADTTRRLARQLASPKDVFLIVEMCDGADGRVATQNALADATGVDASRILCLESKITSSAYISDAASFLSWRAAASAWYREWARERAATLWPAFADARATVRFWGALGGDPEMCFVDARGEDGGSEGNAFGALAPVSAASALRSVAEAANEPSSKTSEEKETSASERRGSTHKSSSAASASAAAASALASAAASRSLGSFLRWAIEGRPQFGIAGAPAIAAARLKSDPNVTRRAALSAALYSYSAAEFAAGFVLSWAVPGPLAAHAAHFTNRFRVCFAVACMAGESPLDPRVAAVVLATCAGADGAATRRAAFAFRDEAFSNGEEGARPTKKDDDGDDNVNTPDDDTSRSSSHSSPTLFGSLTSAVRRVADGGDAIRRDAVEAMRRVYDAGGDAMRRAERDADATATRVFRVALNASERKRRGTLKHVHDDEDDTCVMRVSNRRRVLIASPHSAALETATRAFANRLALASASECAAVVCGPLWLAATQADVVSVLAGAMSVHVCNASLQVFLPPRGTPVFTDASTLLSSSDASRGRGGEKKENDALAETSVLGSTRALLAPAAEMASDAASAAATSLGDVAASAQRVAAEASSSVTRWASAAASVVWANGRRANVADGAAHGVINNAASESSKSSKSPCIRVTRASLLALVADDDARAFARSPSAVVALMGDARAAAAIADDGVRRTLGAFAEAGRRRSTPETNIREGDDDVSDDGGEDDDLSRGEASRRADDFLRDVSAEDESAVLAAVARAVEVLIASGDADARAVAERHGLVPGDGDGDGDGDAAARRAFEAAKRSRYAGYRDAVATVRDKYKSAPDRIGGDVGVGVASDDAGSETSTWFDLFPFVDPFQKSGRTFGASAAPASGTAVAGSE